MADTPGPLKALVDLGLLVNAVDSLAHARIDALQDELSHILGKMLSEADGGSPREARQLMKKRFVQADITVAYRLGLLKREGT